MTDFVPTVPTKSGSVGIGQHFDNIGSPDRPDRPDDPDRFASGEVGKKKFLAELIDHLHQWRGTKRLSESRHVLCSPSDTFECSALVVSVVGTVGMVGICCTNNRLSGDCRSGHGLGWSGHPAFIANDGLPADLSGPSVVSRSRSKSLLPLVHISSAIAGGRNWKMGVSHLLQMAPLRGFSAKQWSTFQQNCTSLLEKWGHDMHLLD